MESYLTILAIVAPIAEKYGKANRRLQSPPQNDPLAVLAHMRAQIANLEISREALSVFRQVVEIVARRVNMDRSLKFYPAATELCTKLGNGIWAPLENYRGAVTYLAFSTLREKRTAANLLPFQLKTFLNQNTMHMETYIKVRYGEPAFRTFRHIQNSLVEVIEGERRQGIQVQQGWPMKFLMRKFRRQPIFWLMYNLNFPVEGRMSWDQVSMWAIKSLRMIGDIEPPTWPMDLPGLDGWNQDATEMWNKAVIEVFTDIRQRFCKFQRLHLAV